MPVAINENEIIYGGNAHPITTCDVNAYMNYKFTVRYLDCSCYMYNPLPTPVQILLFYGTATRDGLHKVILPPGFGTIKICNLQGSKICHYHLSIAGISADHQWQEDCMCQTMLGSGFKTICPDLCYTIFLFMVFIEPFLRINT
jgi:hypothetical protein